MILKDQKNNWIKSSQSDYQREEPKAAFNQQKTKETPGKNKGHSHYTLIHFLNYFKN